MTPEHADLVHRPEDGKRAPLEVGAWAVWEEGADLIPRLHLVRIVDGPRYVKDGQEHAVDELWVCDDGRDRSRWALTRVFVEETSADARAAVACVLAWKPIDKRATDRLALTAMRLRELAQRRALTSSGIPADQRWPDELEELARAAEELAEALAVRHRFVHVSLPNLARNLYLASVLAVAAGWCRCTALGVPHPRAAELSDLIARRTR